MLVKSQKLPPSPPRLPIIGNLHQLGKIPHHSLKALTDKYGPILYLKLGQVPTLVVSSPDIIREIVKSNDIVFSGRPKTLASHILFYGGNNMVFAPYGEYWREARKICMVNLLNLKMVKSFQQVREQEVGVVVDRVRKACLDNNGVAIDLSQILIEALNNIVSECISGKSYRKEDDPVNNVGELTKKLSDHLMSPSVGDFFHCLRWVDVISGLVGRFRSTSLELEAFVDRVIEEHKASRLRSLTEDFLDVLLQMQQDRNLDLKFTGNQVKGIIQDMFTAGIDTTSSTSEWLMAELLRNPTAMMKAREEVRKIGAEKKKIDMNDIDRMVYLKNAVKETLRLHPPAPLLVPHETSARAQIGPYEIPAKTRVLVNALGGPERPEPMGRPR